MSLKIMQKVLILPEADGNDIVKTLVTTATAIDRKKSYALYVYELWTKFMYLNSK